MIGARRRRPRRLKDDIDGALEPTGAELDAGRGGARAARHRRRSTDAAADPSSPRSAAGTPRLEARPRSSAGRLARRAAATARATSASTLFSELSAASPAGHRRGDRRPRPARRDLDAREARRRDRRARGGADRRARSTPGVRVVGVERTDADPSSIELLRRRTGLADRRQHRPASPGEVALVFALRRRRGQLRRQGHGRQPAARPARAPPTAEPRG